ncbi:hypothetical protein G5B40_05480 [Pikeienuella piscinae]|uniref:Uncharacterized protein n=1 Tax=Pikeienuella piscinae TaxID=2748098 RepID=A0A7L5BT25_9RHOB|nr:hypothetical protein [Pikeienuella piscinae]QIE54950.1 hypothetical protein G5B40_05480 [Pikeienuella piscinae]
MNTISPERARDRGAGQSIAEDRSAARRLARETIVNGGVVTPLRRAGLPRFLGRIADAAPCRKS